MVARDEEAIISSLRNQAARAFRWSGWCNWNGACFGSIGHAISARLKADELLFHCITNRDGLD